MPESLCVIYAARSFTKMPPDSTECNCISKPVAANTYMVKPQTSRLTLRGPQRLQTAGGLGWHHRLKQQVQLV